METRRFEIFVGRCSRNAMMHWRFWDGVFQAYKHGNNILVSPGAIEFSHSLSAEQTLEAHHLVHLQRTAGKSACETSDTRAANVRFEFRPNSL